jgi:hypothetical protein
MAMRCLISKIIIADQVSVHNDKLDDYQAKVSELMTKIFPLNSKKEKNIIKEKESQCISLHHFILHKAQKSHNPSRIIVIVK